jgi:N-dimethylarginine dimethylaminohydrolase
MPPLSKTYSFTNLDFIIHQLPERQEPRKLLMCTPEFFGLNEAKLQQNTTQPIRPIQIKRQWTKLKDEYLKLKEKRVIEDVLFLRGHEAIQEMVFINRCFLPWISIKGEKMAIMGKSTLPTHPTSVAYLQSYLEENSYSTYNLETPTHFAGYADAVPHPGKRLIYAGINALNSKTAFDEIAEILDVTVLLLNIINPVFKNLEMCFLPVDIDTVIICPQAFDYDSLCIIKTMFTNIIRIPTREVIEQQSLTTHIMYERKSKTKIAFIPFGTCFVYQALEERGYDLQELDVSEFFSLGASVAALKLMMY